MTGRGAWSYRFPSGQPPQFMPNIGPVRLEASDLGAAHRYHVRPKHRCGVEHLDLMLVVRVTSRHVQWATIESVADMPASRGLIGLFDRADWAQMGSMTTSAICSAIS